MANVVNRSVNIYIESGQAQQAYDRLIKKEKELKDALEKATDPKIVARLNTELKKLVEPLDRAKKKISGEVAPSMRELQATVKSLGDQLRRTSTTDANFDKLVLQLRQAKIELQETKNRAEGLGKELSESGGGFASKLKGFGASILAGFGIGAGIEVGRSITTFLTNAVTGAVEAEQKAARLKATLDNLGRADAFDRLDKQATALSETFRFLDNDDILGVFDQLITYGKLTEQQISELTPVIIDFAAKQRIGLSEAASAIIGSLEGQGKALKQYGIDIKDAGSETDRLNLIMTELKGKVDGAAEAFGETFAGEAASARQELDNLSEDIGTLLIPVLNKALGVVRDLGVSIKNVFNSESLTFLEKLQSFTSSGATLRAIAAQEAAQRAAQRQRDADAARSSGSTTVLGTGAGLATKTDAQLKAEEAKRKKAAEDARREREKAAEEYNRLLDELAAKSRELQFYNAPQLTKDLERVRVFYDKMEERANGNAEALKKIEELRLRETALVIEAYRKAEEEKARKLTEEQAKKAKELDLKRLREQEQAIKEMAAMLAKLADDQLDERRAGAELKVLQSKGQARYAAIVDQLNLEEQIEIAAAEGKEKKIALIQEKYRQKREEAEISNLRKTVDTVLEYLNVTIGALDNIFQAQSDKENRQLDQDRRINEQKKKNFDRQLSAKTISQQEYNKKVEQAEAELEKKERDIRIKQFKRDKVLNIGRAIINTAEGVTEALPNLILAGLVGAAGLVQIGLIASQKPPEFAKGGYLPGPSHKEGGMPVINPRTGRKVAEVEGGEVILSKSTVNNNRSLVDALLYSSMNRGGAPIRPGWANQPVTGMNISGIRRSQQSMRMFETGGVMPAAPENDQLTAVLENLIVTTANLQARLDAGIPAYTIITQNERAQNRLNNIRNAATIK